MFLDPFLCSWILDPIFLLHEFLRPWIGKDKQKVDEDDLTRRLAELTPVESLLRSGQGGLGSDRGPSLDLFI